MWFFSGTRQVALFVRAAEKNMKVCSEISSRKYWESVSALCFEILINPRQDSSLFYLAY